LKTQRLDRPYLRKNGRLMPVSWSEAFAEIAARVAATPPSRLGAIAGDLASVEDMFALQTLLARLDTVNMDCRQDGTKLDPRFGRASYLFNAKVAGIDQADGLLIVGSNPRKESPVLNARIRKRWLRGEFPVGLIGTPADLTYPTQYLGTGSDTLGQIADGSGFAEILRKAQRPIIVLGQGALTRADGGAVLSLAAKAALAVGAVKDGWNGFSVLHTAAARVGGLDLGFVPAAGGLDAQAMAKTGALDTVFLLAADEIDVELGAFVVYQGTHGDRGAHRADVILPAATYTEKSGIYVNTEGRVQIADRANFAPGEAREDWAILRALSDRLGKRLPFDNLPALRQLLFQKHPHFNEWDRVRAEHNGAVTALAELGGAVTSSPFQPAIDDFYLTNPIARASAVMADCSALAAARLRQAAE
jgi:NADH-quinone oxidoreductase subunit G